MVAWQNQTWEGSAGTHHKGCSRIPKHTCGEEVCEIKANCSLIAKSCCFHASCTHLQIIPFWKCTCNQTLHPGPMLLAQSTDIMPDVYIYIYGCMLHVPGPPPTKSSSPLVFQSVVLRVFPRVKVKTSLSEFLGHPCDGNSIPTKNNLQILSERLMGGFSLPYSLQLCRKANKNGKAAVFASLNPLRHNVSKLPICAVLTEDLVGI